MNDAASALQVVDVSRYYVGWSALLPEAILSLAAIALLLLSAFGSRSASERRIPALAIGALVLALLVSVAQVHIDATLFSGMIVIDPYAHFFRIIFCVAGILGITLGLASDEIDPRHSAEYHVLFLFLVVGMMLMAEASDLVMIYVALELVSFMSYILAGFRRHDRRSAEAALKYVIYGGAASGIMLFGLSLVYGLTGHTQLALVNEAIAQIARDVQVSSLSDAKALIPIGLSAGLVLAFAGFAYKIAAVPLHMWSPDVYEGAPTPFTAFLSTGPKAAGFAALLRFFIVGFSDAERFGQNLLHNVSSIPWQLLIIVVSMLTMTLGNLAAIGQANIKRFLAYSSIAHAGYALIGLAAFSKSGAASVLIYMAFYLVMNIGAFYVVIWVRKQTGSELIEDYKGLGVRAPFVALSFAICLFSLTGLPPFAGFIGKYLLFSAALDRAAESAPVIAACAPALAGELSILGRVSCALSGGGAFYALALVGVLNSAVSLYYYARVIRKMFLERPENASPIHTGLSTRLILLPIASFLVIFGVYFSPLEQGARAAIAFRRPTLSEVTPGRTPHGLNDERQASD